VLAAVLALVLVAAAPALAQDEVPACELHDACLDTSEEQKATANQYTESPEPTQAFPVNPASEEAGTPVEDTDIYRFAFEAAKEAGADDETAKEAAEQAVSEANSGGAAKGKDR
jgi:hypothetical protein